MSMSDGSFVDVEITINIGTESQDSKANEKIQEFIAANSINDIEQSIVLDFYDPPGADEDSSIDEEDEDDEDDQ